MEIYLGDKWVRKVPVKRDNSIVNMRHRERHLQEQLKNILSQNLDS